MLVKFKKLHPNAVLPKYANQGDAAMDLTAVSSRWIGRGHEVRTGLAIEIPNNHVGLLFPRSSIVKTGALLANSVGVIDSSFRGEITLVFTDEVYGAGDRIGQLLIVPYPTIEPVWAEELSSTERGAGGFGSSGK